MHRLKQIFLVAMMLTLVVGFLPQSVGACVGKTLAVGAAGSVQQEILAQILSILISERTGTTVKVVKFDDLSSAHQALIKADLDMVIDYTGIGQVQVLKAPPIADPQALYQAVKAGYNQTLNLVWLDPLGFDEPQFASAGMAAQAAPVVRKDTLKKFPALARLINKLGGALTLDAMKSLEAQAAKQDPAVVARDFLKAGRFI